ncbi:MULTISPECIES: phosphate ABC transporter permease subunit PstC [Paenibacillus]|uniref:Phosphate transport system permease protein n=1 Tax=Paenibacillus naphthalenovorans TaxID=162209 RepID=A0A0U2KW44_9BACL|nr:MULTISPECIES: phosphate ABC transporter permease subunit PstC [Paenibacillus]ALS20882.1 phosphate ABC transporter permease [Paenibacillus naphthalenovorans]NTZ18911.1 phosphate ABC transporter permease subunit PstC [Paenibacillus sp. JMULE4]GCL70913.1 phosphate ABC transporter permease subunit PstC [Paenibacillus naphthalenovorans]SDI19042.1 phosphate transport system permease protein [Paenibacillus naphthalenovorans]
MEMKTPRVNYKKKKSMISSDVLIPKILAFFAVISILTTVGIVLILVFESLGFFREVPFWQFITGTEWTPLFSDPKFGVLPLVTGTLLVTLIASIVAIPIGLGSAIYLSEYAPSKVRNIVKPILEILAGIPTIVYGFFALNFVTPVLQFIIPQTEIFNALSAGIVVGIMIIPIICSLSEDAMMAVPNSLRNGAYALGSTKLEVALKIVVPAALSGIIASFVLGLSRAVGETMIVTLAAGNLAQMAYNPLQSIQTLTAYIVSVSSGDTSYGSVEYMTIYAVGITLFVMTLAMNILARTISKRFREEY